MTLDSSKYGDAMVCLDVPEPEVVVLGDGEEEVRVLGVKLELVDALPVAHVVLDAVHRRGVEHSHDAPGTGRRLHTENRAGIQSTVSSIQSKDVCSIVFIYISLRNSSSKLCLMQLVAVV